MADEERAPCLSLVELLSHQTTAEGDSGIRLALHPSLVEPLQLCSYPYLYAAAQGNIALALHIYAKGFMHSAQLVIGTLCSGGVDGRTPWQKPLAVSPSEVARLAGHPRAAQVLSRMELGLPLQWSPARHAAFPAPFRRQARALMQVLSSSGWFVALPGPARTIITQHLMQDLCLSSSSVWGAVTPQEWTLAKQGDFGPELNEQLAVLMSALSQQQMKQQAAARQRQQQAADGEGDGAEADEADSQQGGPVVRQWQFRMAYQTHAGQRRKGWQQLLHRVVPVMALAALALGPWKRERTMLMAYLAGTCAGMGGCLTLPGAALLLAQLACST